MEFFSSRALFHRHAQLSVAFGVGLRRTVTVKFLSFEQLFQITAPFEPVFIVRLWRGKRKVNVRQCAASTKRLRTKRTVI